MAMNTTSVDRYLAEGCGRCDRYQTPACKVHRWTPILVALRDMLNATELTETVKWGSPCYTLDGANVAMIASFNTWCALTFFKGLLLADPDGLLERPGPNAHAGRVLRFRTVEEFEARREPARTLLAQAIELQRHNATVPKRSATESVPDELARLLSSQPELQAAYDALTPGRQRSHILHIAGAKQSKTRAARAERCAAKLRSGKGFNER